MRTRLASLLLVALFGVAGCGSAPPDKKIALEIEPAAPPGQRTPLTDRLEPTPAVATPAPAPDPASVLARKAEQYAKTVQPAMERRNATTATPPKAPAPQPPARQSDSLGQFVDPNQFKIGEGDAEKGNASAKVAMSRTADLKPTDQPVEVQANSGAAIDPAPKTDASNRPVALSAAPDATKASVMMSPGIDSLEARLAGRARDYPRDVSANLDYQLLLFLRDEPVPQLAAITALPTEDRELVSAVMDGLSNLRSTLHSDNNMLFSRKIRPITDLSDRLKQQADLTIPTLALCTKVEGFGRYDPIDPPRLTAQKERQAIIYCELENFASQFNGAKQWQTDVIQEAILYTEDGMQVWADKTPPIQDLSRNRRHDFFLSTLVKFPPTLTVGRYMLKVTIIDRQANRVAEASLPIQVGAQ
jgi:hypothetical protein